MEDFDKAVLHRLALRDLVPFDCEIPKEDLSMEVAQLFDCFEQQTRRSQFYAHI